MKKRLTALFLAFALLCALLPAAILPASAYVYSGTCGAEGDNLAWSLDTETGVLEIAGIGEMYNWNDSTPINAAPWNTYKDFIKSVSISNGVTNIASRAFSGCSVLTSMTIPDGVTSIGAQAFYACSGLTSITIPDSVTSIGYAAFESCTGLTSVTIPDSVTSIGSYAFYGCRGLTSITIPDSVTSIGTYAFCNCTGLTSATFSDSVKSIGDSAFYGCSGLTSITIPDSVTSIGSYAFANCSALTNITIQDNVTSIGCYAFKNTGYYKNAINWAGGVLYIGKYLIKAEYSVKNAYVIKAGTKLIADNAFYGCSELTSVTIPNSMTAIGNFAFRVCDGLTAVHITDIAAWCRISFSSNPLLYAHNLYLNGKLVTDLVIPDGVTSISDSAFSCCTRLTSVTIPASVTSIGYQAIGYDWDEGAQTYEAIDGFTIYGCKDSAAQTYAEENGFSFVVLGNTPSEPFTGVLLSDIPAGGTAFILYNAETGVAMGAETIGGKSGGIKADTNEENGNLKLYAGTGVFKLTNNGDGTYYLTCGGRYLTCTAANAFEFAESKSSDAKWKIEKTTGGFFIKSATKIHSSGPATIEVYNSAFSPYGFDGSTNAAIFTMQFYAVNEALADPDGDGYLGERPVAGEKPANGEKVVIYNDNGGMCFGPQNDDATALVGIESERNGNTLDAGNGSLIFTVHVSGNYYAFENRGKYLRASENEIVDGKINNDEYLYLDAFDNDYSWWKLEEVTGGYIIYNKTAKYRNSSICIEYFSSSFSGWTYNGSTALFAMRFFQVEDPDNLGYVVKPDAPPTVIPGDVNGSGDVDTVDAIRLAKYLVELVELTDAQKLAADVTGDGDVSTTDSIRLAKYLVGLIDTLETNPPTAAHRDDRSR